MIPIEDVRGMLESAFPGDRVELSSPMGDDNHFQLVVISEKFNGKSMVEQHQLVYGALGDAMKEAIHALALQTVTPEQWQQAAGS